MVKLKMLVMRNIFRRVMVLFSILTRTFKSKLHSDMLGNDRAMCFLSVFSHGGVIMIR